MYLQENPMSLSMTSRQIQYDLNDTAPCSEGAIFFLELLLSFNYILVFSAVLTHTAGSRVLELSDR